MNDILTTLNAFSAPFCRHALAMLLQSSLLILILLAVDLLIRHRARAVVRYALWMLLLVKLALPPGLASPLSVGAWIGGLWAPAAITEVALKPEPPSPAGPYADTYASTDSPLPEPIAPLTADLAHPITDNRQPLTMLPLTPHAYLFLSWLLGVFVLSAILLHRGILVLRLLRTAVPADAALLALMDGCRRAVGLRRRNVRLRIVPETISPAVCGIFRPTILLPAYLIDKLSADQLRSVLIHELAHIKRNDLPVNLIQTLLQILYFYNPLLWLANARIRRIREQAVDELSLVSLGHEAPAYGHVLLDIAELAFHRPSLSLRLIGVVESKKALAQRIRHIVSRPLPKTAKVGLAGLLAVVAIAAVVLPMARGENKPGISPSPTPTSEDGAPAAETNASPGSMVSQAMDESGIRMRLQAAGLTNITLKAEADGTWMLDLTKHDIGDLSVLHGMPLSWLSIEGKELRDLSPLKGLPLKTLYISRSPVRDLSPLRGAPLEKLLMLEVSISDVSALRGMPLTTFMAGQSMIRDLAPLKGMPLKALSLYSAPVADISPLAGMPLASIDLAGTQVSDLSPLLGMRLKTLSVDGTQVTDLSPLKGMAIEDISFDTDTVTNEAEVLRPMISLKRINRISSELFWGRHDAAASPWQWTEQRNPTAGDFKAYLDKAGVQYDSVTVDKEGKCTVRLRGGNVNLIPLVGMPVAELDLMHTDVSDLAPLKGARFKELNISGLPVSDLSPLSGMPLTRINASGTAVSDLRPLAGMPLTVLSVSDTAVVDLSPLKGMPLTVLELSNTAVEDLGPLAGAGLGFLSLDGTKVSSLSPLAGMPLAHLALQGSRVSDLSPLKGMPFQQLDLSRTDVTDLGPLHGMPLTSLVLVGTAVEDITPLAGMPLRVLNLTDTRVVDIAPLQGIQLRVLAMRGTPVSDLGPLRGMPLMKLDLDLKRLKAPAFIETMPFVRLSHARAWLDSLGPATASGKYISHSAPSKRMTPERIAEEVAAYRTRVQYQGMEKDEIDERAASMERSMQASARGGAVEYTFNTKILTDDRYSLVLERPDYGRSYVSWTDHWEQFLVPDSGARSVVYVSDKKNTNLVTYRSPFAFREQLQAMLADEKFLAETAWEEKPDGTLVIGGLEVDPVHFFVKCPARDTFAGFVIEDYRQVGGVYYPFRVFRGFRRDGHLSGEEYLFERIDRADSLTAADLVFERPPDFPVQDESRTTGQDRPTATTTGSRTPEQNQAGAMGQLKPGTSALKSGTTENGRSTSNLVMTIRETQGQASDELDVTDVSDDGNVEPLDLGTLELQSDTAGKVSAGAGTSTSRHEDMALPLGEGVQMEFVWIEAMGCWVGKFEVSNVEYRQFMPGHDSGSYGNHSLNGDDQPVVEVHYNDAVAFAKWMTRGARATLPKGYRVRLPDGEEWMRFAQCGDGRLYPWGNDWPTPKYGNYDGLMKVGKHSSDKTLRYVENYDDGFDVSCAGRYAGRNEWGLYGVGGNVWEWTSVPAWCWQGQVRPEPREREHPVNKVFGGCYGTAQDLGMLCSSREARGIALPTETYADVGFRLLVTPYAAKNKGPRSVQSVDPFARPTDPTTPPNSLAGQVVDKDGIPMEGVQVDVWTWRGPAPVSTDGQGMFHVKGISVDSKMVEVRFSKKDYSPVYMFRQPIGQLKYPLMMTQDTYFEGTVIDAVGQSATGVLIRANSGPRRAEGVTIGETVLETRTSEEGRYRLYVQDDTYEITATAPTGVARVEDVRIARNEARRVDFKLDNGVTFVAKVIDAQTKEPVNGIALYDWKRKEVNGVSDAQGHVEIARMQTGPIAVRVKGDEHGYVRWWSEDAVQKYQRFSVSDMGRGWQRNFDNLEFDVKPGMSTVLIEVEKGVRVLGTVLDPEGNPAPGATVAPALTGTGNSITGDTRFSVETDETGHFDMLLPASKLREYNLIAHDGRFEEWRNWANGIMDPVHTQPGDELTNVVLRLTRPCIVRGIAVDKAGRPVAGREVRASALDMSDNRYYVPTTRTDENGAFELKHVHPGEHFVQVAPFWLSPDQAPQGTSQIVVAVPNSPVADVRLVAEEGK